MSALPLAPVPGAARPVVIPVGLTAALARLGLQVGRQPLPAEVSRRATHSLLDWFAVAHAAWNEKPVQLLLAEARHEGAAPRASFLDGSRGSAVQAALVNGTSSHVLDFDDAHLHSRVHPSVPLWPAILALGEEGGLPGARALGAFAAGVELQSRVAALMGEDHYALGWHNTATLGCLGAATACSSLLGLDEERACHALSIAATQAAGMRALFGTPCKPLHAGHAAAVGLRAARLAAAGFTGVTDILERDDGFARLYADRLAPADPMAEHARSRVAGIVFKYHASCYGTQAPVDACLALVEATGVDPARAAALQVTVERQYLTVCCIAEPRTASQARFSIAHMAALVLAGRNTVAPESFGAQALADPVLAALRAKVTVRGDDAMPRAQAEAVLTLTDGSQARRRCDASRPEADLDRQQARLSAKARSLLLPLLGAGRTDALVAGCLDFAAVPDMADFFCRTHRHVA